MRLWSLVLTATLLGACSRDDRSTPTQPTASSTPQPFVLEVPRLLSPEPDAFVRQNDATIGCPGHWAWGYGFQISFDWSDPKSSEGIAGYEIISRHRDSLNPAIDMRVAESRLLHRRCSTFVADRNLSGWTWTVRAVDRLGNVSAWSEERPYRFERCRVAPGQPCWAPPE